MVSGQIEFTFIKEPQERHRDALFEISAWDEEEQLLCPCSGQVLLLLRCHSRGLLINHLFSGRIRVLPSQEAQRGCRQREGWHATPSFWKCPSRNVKIHQRSLGWHPISWWKETRNVPLLSSSNWRIWQSIQIWLSRRNFKETWLFNPLPTFQFWPKNSHKSTEALTGNCPSHKTQALL